MIITGPEIIKRREKGDIYIDSFNSEKVNPNSYNLKLDNKLLSYCDNELDMKKDNKTYEIFIPEDGLVLVPGRLYLGKTLEYTKTFNLVPMLEGRSSLGRLGIFVHVTAGFGDVGFCGRWTLEISVVKPVRIYRWIECCQIYYHTIEGDIVNYSGKYQSSKDIKSSELYKEFM